MRGHHNERILGNDGVRYTDGTELNRDPLEDHVSSLVRMASSGREDARPPRRLITVPKGFVQDLQGEANYLPRVQAVSARVEVVLLHDKHEKAALRRDCLDRRSRAASGSCEEITKRQLTASL